MARDLVYLVCHFRFKASHDAIIHSIRTSKRRIPRTALGQMLNLTPEEVQALMQGATSSATGTANAKPNTPVINSSEETTKPAGNVSTNQGRKVSPREDLD